MVIIASNFLHWLGRAMFIPINFFFYISEYVQNGNLQKFYRFEPDDFGAGVPKLFFGKRAKK